MAFDGLVKAVAKKVVKAKKVNLGAKGSFTIQHPGALRAKAKAAGETTAQFAKSHSKGNSTTARQSRAAIGLMAMGKK